MVRRLGACLFSYEFGMAHLFIFFIICNAHHHLEWGRLETLEPLIVLGKLNHFQKIYMVAHLELSPKYKMQKGIDCHTVIIVHHRYILQASCLECGLP